MSNDFKCIPYGISDFNGKKSLNGKKVKKSKATLFLNFCR